MISRNERTMNVKMTRFELCDVLMALTLLDSRYNGSNRFKNLHDKLRNQLNSFDKELDERLINAKKENIDVYRILFVIYQ